MMCGSSPEIKIWREICRRLTPVVLAPFCHSPAELSYVIYIYTGLRTWYYKDFSHCSVTALGHSLNSFRVLPDSLCLSLSLTPTLLGLSMIYIDVYRGKIKASHGPSHPPPLSPPPLFFFLKKKSKKPLPPVFPLLHFSRGGAGGRGLRRAVDRMRTAVIAGVGIRRQVSCCVSPGVHFLWREF